MKFVRFEASSLNPMFVLCGVPHGSVLGPILFLLYTADVIRIIETHSLLPHLHADDTQIYGFCLPGSTVQLQSRVSACIDDVSQWMKSNRLQLNATKTEVIWCSSTRRQHQIPTAPLMIGSDAVHPALFFHNLGMYIDADLIIPTKISRILSSCFAIMRQICSM